MSAQQKTTRRVRSGDLKSLRDFVEDNLLCAGRQSYYQRIIIVSKHKQNSNMRNIYTTVYTETNKNVLEDKMTGLFLIYRHFGVILVEGSEAVLGKFITKLTAVQEECLVASLIVAIYNNANQVNSISLQNTSSTLLTNFRFQRMFNKIISRMGEPSTRIELPNTKDSTDTLDIVSRFLRTIYALCKRINSDDLDDSNAHINYTLSSACPFKYHSKHYRRLPLPPHVVQQVLARNGSAGVALFLSRAHAAFRVHATGV